jgi:ribosome-associated toxin RatA of RatAB toxin-antitoxin module
VRAEVLGFSHYPEFMPHYAKCRILGRSPSGGRDVYMEVEALHGAITMWARLDVKKPVRQGDVETIDTSFLQGNVKNLYASWKLERVDDQKTKLTLEVFLDPKLPLPNGIVNRENLDGSAAGVLAMKARVEQRLSSP